jgi:starvation-inducible DNA-binding protein
LERQGRSILSTSRTFDKLAGTLVDFVDLIAERITAIGGAAMGTARMASSTSRLPEYPADIADGMQVVDALAKRYASLAATTRAAIDIAQQSGDMDTSDLFIEVSRGLDKALWFLEAHLQA